MSGDNQPAVSGAILITGASSGIGAALARAYARKGLLLALGGRDAGRLEAIAGDCRRAGATVLPGLVDVTDRQGMAEWVATVEGLAPLDLVIANAGISGGGGGSEADAGQRRRMLAVNFEGTLNTVEPALAPMLKRRRGQIALMSSLGAFRGMPSAPAYCASKAAIRVYGEALRARLRGSGVTVSVVCPGFVRTPLTARNPFPMPLIMEPERAAALIKIGLERKRPQIAFPWPGYLAVRLLAALPRRLADRWLARLPAKE
ncbi:MAG: SDR family NAD(P)-dependent oxidoreductase [Geminicoccales bacterium]